MKKIGLLALALVLALGALGVGYAAWTDTVTIEGTVNTGTVDIVVENYSGMWMWKLPGYTPDYELTTDPNYKPPPQLLNYDKPFIVAYSCAAQTSAGATPAPVDDSVTVTFNNLFPLMDGGRIIPWEADFECHYVGSIPVKVMLDPITITADSGMDLSGLTTNVSGYVKLNGASVWTKITNEQLEGLQLHYCDWVRFVVEITVPQHATEAENAPNMGQSGTITGQIKVIQWNEYKTPG